MPPKAQRSSSVNMPLVLAVITVASVLSLSEAYGQPSETAFVVPEVQQPPRLEDFLSDAPATRALRIDTFVQRNPGDGEPASERTVAYLSRDQSSLYVVFVCHDRQPQNVRAHLTKREQTLADDLVGVFLDTFHDRRRAYVFLANARGIQRDSALTEGQGEDVSFDTLWESRGQFTPTGYAVWMAIPFKSLRFPSGAAMAWGIGLTRRIPRTSEEVFWPQVSRRVEGIVPQLTTVAGFEGVRPGRNVQMIPYGAFADASFLDSATQQPRSDRDARGGLDLKVVGWDRFTFDVTANPDFSHVETDDPQVTINQRYEVYFPEKRPFFLENASTFQTPETLFFSRRIVSPRWGTRVTGKAGRWIVGSLVAQDRLGTGEPAGEALVGVARLQREVGRESTVGALVTSRDAGSTRNQVASIDARIRVGPRWTVQAQLARSFDDRADDDQAVQGTSSTIEVTRADRHLTLVNRYRDRSPHFASQLGFIPRTDIRQAFQLSSYRWRPKSTRLLAFGPGLASSVTWDYAGRPLDREINPHFGFEFGGATQVLISAFDNRETFANKEFPIRAAQLHVSSSWLKWMELAGFFQRGTRINYAPAEGLTPFLGQTTDAFARVTFRPAARLAIEQSYIFTRLESTASSEGAPHTGRIFAHQIARSRVSLQVTRALSVRAILDYNNIASDERLTAIAPGTRVRADLLGTFQLNPWTALYIGYTEGLEDIESGDSLGLRRRADWYRSARQVFAKVSYVLRF